MIEEDMREVKDRSRRIETRLTKLLNHMGFDPQGSLPEWTPGEVAVPSTAVAFKDILAVVPEDWHASFWVTHKGEYIARIVKGD